MSEEDGGDGVAQRWSFLSHGTEREGRKRG